MKRVVWIAAIAAGALFAGNQASRAQYGGPYPPPYVPPPYTQQQVVPDLVPTVNLQPWSVTQPGQPPTLIPGRPRTYPPDTHTGYANERNIVTGWYVGGMVGARYLEDQFSEAVSSNQLRQFDAAFDWNAAAGGAIGYRMPVRPHDMGQLRFEVDFLTSKNNVKRLILNGADVTSNNEVSGHSFMFNTAIDFIHVSEAITPYIGGGIGFMHVREDLQSGTINVVDSNEVFAWQGMAGIAVQLWEHVEWFTEWRYLGGSKPKFTSTGPVGTTQRIELRSEYNSHSVMTGFRIDLQ
jgi:opacity protein-like surface antigen